MLLSSSLTATGLRPYGRYPVSEYLLGGEFAGYIIEGCVAAEEEQNNEE